MDAESRQPNQDQRRRAIQAIRARRALWCAAGGIIVGLTAAVCSGIDVISMQQAIAMALPAALLIVGGLMVAVADTQSDRGQGFQAGFSAGSLLSRLRSIGCGHDKGGP
jgi:hypothetical protein